MNGKYLSVRNIYIVVFLATGEEADREDRFHIISLKFCPVPSNLRSS